eukprot:TRINITY_DN27866_c0_g1_i2.p2 TRINITY_DN27866_c0_g1~~TRINITY_DN27866_c0_g1_i2.p2  ORF type:complete len:109 (-),score=15.98 TRINITY_DN27866_c0_g1_i2:122-448(-)
MNQNITLQPNQPQQQSNNKHQVIEEEVKQRRTEINLQRFEQPPGQDNQESVPTLDELMKQEYATLYQYEEKCKNCILLIIFVFFLILHQIGQMIACLLYTSPSPRDQA